MSSSNPWMKFYVRDYLNDLKVQALSFEDKGLYTDMLFLMWDNGGYLPADLSTIAKIFKLSEKKFAKKFHKISFFFQKVETDGNVFLTQKRLLEEMDKLKEISRERSQAGKKGVVAKQANGQVNGQANDKQLLSVCSDFAAIDTESDTDTEKDINILRPDEALGESLILKSQDPEKPESPPKRQEPLGEWFEKFYAHYPRKADRKRAHTAFMAIFSKSPPSKHRAIMENLVLRLTSYVAERENDVKSDPERVKYTKLPATWLHAHDFTIPPSEEELVMQDYWEPVET